MKNASFGNSLATDGVPSRSYGLNNRYTQFLRRFHLTFFRNDQ